MRGRASSADRSGDPTAVPSTVRTLGFYEARGNCRQLELGEQLLTLAQRVPDPALLLEAHHAGSNLVLAWRGASAGYTLRRVLRSTIRSTTAPWPGSTERTQGRMPVVCRQGLWFLGHPDQALTRSHDALTLAQEVAHPFNTRMH